MEFEVLRQDAHGVAEDLLVISRDRTPARQLAVLRRGGLQRRDAHVITLKDGKCCGDGVVPIESLVSFSLPEYAPHASIRKIDAPHIEGRAFG